MELLFPECRFEDYFQWKELCQQKRFTWSAWKKNECRWDPLSHHSFERRWYWISAYTQ
jgi:Type IIA topoisomerase (DNA gyrase/topo II, topoisomerase IV), B subunit